MEDKGAGEPFLGIIASEVADYDGIQPSDTVSLSDSDPEDFGLADEAEVDTISPEESLSLDDVVCGSGENPESLKINLKSPVQPFHLKGMSSTFSMRSQSIFDCLEGAAKLAAPSLAEDNIIDGRFKRPLPPATPPSKMAPESFGRQGKPPPTTKSSPSVPDYVTHPERWTKYSLEGVSESSDKTNREVAMEFLGGLKKKGGEHSSSAQDSYIPYFNQDPSSCGAGRIVFMKPTKMSIDSLERKRSAGDDDKKSFNTKQSLKRKSPKTAGDLKVEDSVELGHLGSGEKKAEEGCLNLKDLCNKGDPGTGSGHTGEEAVGGTVGFHSSKKRNRKVFRPKVEHEEED
ncbi:PREDICTED: protein TSSC4 isoform X1 [Crocodylus porosus]|uniref:U5 small nuclear ribonucleoprotein TSSC4 n=1 Tax=Crocodylus porosus TaxID=8502 RepID=A0A7M4FL34_CROPO|nr:PREDICTED: protein TSSC4 isoform X1 [Crocodylus porosus]XP_019407593.1 PREDICTED: protein TSSC4 isoform X1 [Crocodylus porosus]